MDARLLLLAPLLLAQPIHARAPSPAGTWHGSWSSPDGSVYSATATLKATSDTVIEGSILWTLSAATRADLKPKIGQSGTEFVRGVLHPDCLVIQMAGYQLEDPQHILGMDDYRLIIAPNGAGIGGVTGNNGAWTGMISLLRVTK